MAVQSQLDVAGASRKGFVSLLLLLSLLARTAVAQDHLSEQDRLQAARSAVDNGQWEEALQLTKGPADQSPEFDLFAGLALAHFEKWDEAKLAFEAGMKKSPKDPRFATELAGISYRQKDFRTAKRYLRAALRLNPSGAYDNEFLATIYFLEGNLEAALKYWYRDDKPRLRSVRFEPQPLLKESVRDGAIAFNPPQVLSANALLTTEYRLDNLGVFSHRRFELTPSGSGSYDATLHLGERNGWGESTVEGIVSFLSGVPYSTAYPEFYNLGNRAINLTSLVRWDPEKRRVSLTLSMPLYGNPSLRLRLFADGRDENWNLTQTLFNAGPPPSDLNIRRVTAGAEIRSVMTGLWSWSAGAEIANRDFRNLTGQISPAERPFFTSSTSLAGWLGIQRTLWRVPEHRFTIDSSAQTKAGREFAAGLGPFATLRGSLQAHWDPRGQGDDYEMQGQVRAGATAGKTTVDELFQLGVERDNDLWLRGHDGTFGGRKGNAPLGRRYFLANWELDKNVYRNGLFTVKIGPFLDSGSVADSSNLFGSNNWLWDSGVQCKVRVLGNLTVVLSYGRSLRGGKGVFFGAVPR